MARRTVETIHLEARERVNVIHVLAPARFGGLESVVRALATAQAAVGNRVKVCLVLEPPAPSHPMTGPLEGAGVDVMELRLGPMGYAREARTVLGCIRQDPSTVLHTHGYRADVVDGLPASFGGLATISTVHGFTGGDWKNRAYERLQKWALRRVGSVVAVSRPIARELVRSRVPEERIMLIPNAYADHLPLVSRGDARRRLGIPPSEFAIGWVGRISPEKGPDLVMRALALLPDPSIALTIIGDGPLRPALEESARAQGLAHRMRWTGEVPEAGTLLRAFDAFVLSSRTEGTPIVLFEAMRAALPIVATSVGGVPDVLSDAEASLVDAEDPAAIARELIRIRSEPREAATRAQAARRRLREEFGVDRWIQRYEEAYRRSRERAGRGTAAAERESGRREP